MLKKIKDLNRNEIEKICHSYQYCTECPIRNDLNSNSLFCIREYRDIQEQLRDAYLDKEVELEDDDEKSIYRKLKEYIKEDGNTIHSIFGTLMDPSIVWCFKPVDSDSYVEKQIFGVYGGEYDFLLEYYVKGIIPSYKIIDDRIVPLLEVTLDKEL